MTDKEHPLKKYLGAIKDPTFNEEAPEPPAKIPFKWQRLQAGKKNDTESYTNRVKVIGGWILHSFSWRETGSCSESMQFIPDAFHQWEIEE